MTDIYIFKAKIFTASAHGSEWTFKGSMPPGTHDEYLEAVRSGDDNAAANALGTLYGDGTFMIFDLTPGAGLPGRRFKLDVTETRAYRAKAVI